MNEERIKKELKGLNKVKPPRDFIYQLHSRLEEKPKQFIFPLKLASTIAVLLVAFSIYKVIGPQYQLPFKAPGTKMEEGVRESLVRKAKAKAEAKVVRSRAVSKKKAPVSIAAAPVEMEKAMMGAGAVSRSSGMVADMAMAPTALISLDDIDKVKYIISLADGKVLYVRSSYIVAEIPNAKKDSFIKMISQFDYVKKPTVIETKENSVHYRIKLIPEK